MSSTFLGVPSGRTSDPFQDSLFTDDLKPTRIQPQKKLIQKQQQSFERRKSLTTATTSPSILDDDDDDLYHQQQPDDTRSFYSQNTYVQQQQQIYPPIPKELREIRKHEYHLERNPNKTMEEVQHEKDERIELNHVDIEGRYHRTEFSRTFMTVKTSAHVPDYCTNLHEGKFFGEVVLAKSQPCIYKPQNSKGCFGSIWDWGQGGEDIPPRATPGGDLSNVYMIQTAFTKFSSTCPFSVGVLVGEVKRAGKFRPLGRRSVYVDSTYYSADNKDIENWDGESFHYVIYPNEKFSGGVCPLYQSGPHLNNEYGRDYSFLTSDEKKIQNRCEPIGEKGRNGFIVPVRHPVISWCFEESDLPEEEMPQKSSDHSSKTEAFYHVKYKVMKMATEALRLKAELFIPVTDMRQFAVKFVPLSNGPFSQDQTHREELKRTHLLDTKYQKSFDHVATVHDSKKKQKDRELKEISGVSFNIQYFTMFRGFVADAVVDQEQQNQFETIPEEDD
jgi:hypothetical protein